MNRFRYLQLGVAVLLLCCCGCPSSSGDIGLVEGVVTLNGTPVEEATVRFYPATGRGSSGKTDKDGRYKLRYTRSTIGALIGKHKVTISTEVESDAAYGGSSEGREESIPENYLDRRKTELTATVESGKNVIDFDLKSE